MIEPRSPIWEVGARSFSGTRSALERVVEADGEDLILARIDLTTRECDVRSSIPSSMEDFSFLLSYAHVLVLLLIVLLLIVVLLIVVILLLIVVTVLIFIRASIAISLKKIRRSCNQINRVVLPLDAVDLSPYK